MVTATQSADKSELGARLEKRVDHGLSGVLDTGKRSSTACPIARLVATAQVHQRGALLIDRDPAADNGLAFLRDIEPGVFRSKNRSCRQEFRSAHACGTARVSESREAAGNVEWGEP
jgi:hypothetical protein